jgi:predicted acylesterase/phospholipase RssA
LSIYIFPTRRSLSQISPQTNPARIITWPRPIIHREGPVWEAVRGSLALPGIFAPLPYQGSLIVDGGVMNNTPIDLMREAYPGAWIAGVNVNPTTEMLEDYTFGPGISGLRLLFNKLNPLSDKTKAPSIFSTLTRSTEIKGIYQMEMVREMADLIIQPDVSRWGFMDFRPAAEIADAGYRAALPRVAEIVTDLQDKGFQLS